MEDIIDIIVTETTNLITITSSGSDEVIDVNIIDNREDIVLNVTPSVVEININSLTSNFGVSWGQITGTLSNQTDLNTALGLKADLVGGKVPSSQLPSYVDDIIEVANYAALPATGETGKIYITLDTNFMYRWSGSTYIEIKDSSAVWGAITGTLSSQTDLQNALNAKFDDPTGDTTQYIAGDGSLVTFPIAGQAGTLVREVRNTTGATLTKGTIVYISGATGNKPTVSKAIATGDSTSAQTFGMLQANIANNANGYAVCVGDLTGLDTSAFTEGNQLYLSSTTAGTYTVTKQLAPAHLVYIGIVTRAHPTLGQIEVNIQNGYELYELHDVSITSESDNQGLFYEVSTDLWKNKSIATVLGYSPEQPLTFSSPLSRATNAVSIPAATTSVNGYLTSTDWTTFNAKQAALSGTGFVKISGTTISYDNSTYLTTSAAASTYLALAGGTMTGAIVGTTASFANSGSGIALGVTQSGASGDGIRITHSLSRAFTIQSSGSGFGILINNDTASTSAPFTIQKQGSAVVAFTDAGAGTFNSSLTANSFIKTSGTSSQFLKADGSVDSSTYAKRSGLTDSYLPAWSSSLLGGSLTDSFISYASNITYVSGMGLSTLNGLDIEGNYGAGGGGLKIRSYDETTGNAYIDFASTGGRMYLGLNRSTASGLMTNATAYATVLTTGLGTTNLEFGTNATKRMTIDGTSGNVTLTGALSGTSASFTGNVSILANSARLTVSESGGAEIRVTAGGSSGFIGTYSNHSLTFLTNSATALTLANTGAATFSSSVGINGGDFRYRPNGDATNSPALVLKSPTAGILSLCAEVIGDANANSNSLSLRVSNPTNGRFDALTILPSGNVGIGTATPQYPLEVNGDIQTTNLSGNTSRIKFGQFGSAGTSYTFIQGDARTSGYMAFYTDVTERMRITSGGDVLMGTTTNFSQEAGANLAISVKNSASKWGINMQADASGAFRAITFYNSAGTSQGYISVDGSGTTTYSTTSSDLRLKQNINKWDENVLGAFSSINPKTFEFKGYENPVMQKGFIAQDMVSSFPEAYPIDEKGYYSFNPSGMVVYLMKAIKDLKLELDTLKNK